jgi:Lipocalin-like domain
MKDALVGTWKLVSATETTEKGEQSDAFGRNPIGFITYTPDGRMMAIISNGGRKPLSTIEYIKAPVEERAESFATFAAYAGTYTLEINRVIHHVQVAWLENWVGTDQIRTIVKLQDNELILRSPPSPRGSVMVTAVLVWHRWRGDSISN